MNRHMTRAKRAKLAYSAIRKMTYLAGFSEGIAQERRMVDRLNRCAFEQLNHALKEADQLESERDEARRELEALKSRYKIMSACNECQFYNHECTSPDWCSSWIAEE